jgi:hypothetical protein
MPAHKKPDEEKKLEQIRIRVTEDQKQLLETAAAMEGAGVATWLRLVGIKAARSVTRADDLLWDSFEEELSKYPEWECVAPRSGFAHLQADHIYKVMLRATSPKGRRPRKWWYFEAGISLNTTDYAEVGYGDRFGTNSVVNGPASLLCGFKAEPRGQGKLAPPGLARALALIQAKFCAPKAQP